MIYVNKEDISEESFISLLGETRVKLIDFYKKNSKSESNGTSFENSVFSEMTIAAQGTAFEGYIEQTGAHTFPDIIARKLYGTEVKMTIGDKWISTGNSVLETTRFPGLETIYMFFGKFGKSFDIKFRKYQDCLYDVGVTHSPRYKINMELDEDGSIFHKMGIDYDAFRKHENSIGLLKSYYRRQLKDGEELWWIDSTQEDRAVSPIIKTFSTLEKEIREQFICETMILFPEVFGKSTDKFDRPAAYLVSRYNAVSSHLRDSFTAGGRITISINNELVTISRLSYNLYLRSKAIREIIQLLPQEILETYWKIPIKADTNILDLWKELTLAHSTEEININLVFEAGLYNDQN